MGEKRGAYTVVVGRPEGKLSLERPRHKWVKNFKMDLKNRIGLGLD
jgi:hypothetical protein